MEGSFVFFFLAKIIAVIAVASVVWYYFMRSKEADRDLSQRAPQKQPGRFIWQQVVTLLFVLVGFAALAWIFLRYVTTF